MKKLLSVLLALALTLSLGALALAYEDYDSPLYAEYGYGSLEEMLADWEMTEEEYGEWVDDQRAEDAWHETYDEAKHDFDPELWAHYGYDSKEEMLEWWEIDEAGYAAQVDDELFSYKTAHWTDEQWEAYFDEQFANEKKAMGLLYDINVMLGSEPMAFTDAVPEIVNGRTMVPLRAVMEGLGAQVEFDNAAKTVTIAKDGKTLTFVLGGDTFKVDDNGIAGEIRLDSAPYLKNDRVFVPLRFISEALGYDVQWSSAYRTAVVLDRQAIVDEINQKFTVANAVLAMGSELDLTRTYKGESKLDIKVTMLDSIQGDKTYTGSVKAAVVQNDHAASATVTYDMEGFLRLIADQISAYDETAEEELQEVLDMLGDGIDMIMDLDSMKLYFRGALFASVMEDVDSKTWLAMDLGAMLESLGMDPEMLKDYATAPATMGDMLYMLGTAGFFAEPVFSYETILTAAESYSSLDDSHFTKKGSKWHYEEDLLATLDASMYVGGDSGSVKADVAMSGDKATRVTGSLDYYTESGGYGPAMQIACDFDWSALAAKMTGTVKVKNTCNVEFTLTANSQQANVTVPTAPPAGAKIVDAGDLF